MEAGKAQDDMEEIDGERLPSVEAHNSQPPRKKTWRSGVRFATCAASHLPRVDPINVDDASVPAC